MIQLGQSLETKNKYSGISADTLIQATSKYINEKNLKLDAVLNLFKDEPLYIEVIHNILPILRLLTKQFTTKV